MSTDGEGLAHLDEVAIDPKQLVENLQMLGEQWVPKAIEAAAAQMLVELRQRIRETLTTLRGRHGNVPTALRLDLETLTRRVERGLGVVVRRGQQPGPDKWIRTSGDDTRNAELYISPYKVAGVCDRSRMHALYALADGVTDQEFELALAACRAHGNVSRNSVLRQLRGKELPVAEEARARIAAMAGAGHSTEQIATALNRKASAVRAIARKYGIALRADAVAGMPVDTRRVVVQAEASMRAVAASLRLISDPTALDPALLELHQSLSKAALAVNSFARRMRKAVEHAESAA